MELWITYLCSAQTKVANREVAAHTMWLKGVSLVSSFLLNVHLSAAVNADANILAND